MVLTYNPETNHRDYFLLFVFSELLCYYRLRTSTRLLSSELCFSLDGEYESIMTYFLSKTAAFWTANKFERSPHALNGQSRVWH